MPTAEPSPPEPRVSLLGCQRSPTDGTATIVDCHTHTAWQVRTEAELLALSDRLINEDTAGLAPGSLISPASACRGSP